MKNGGLPMKNGGLWWFTYEKWWFSMLFHDFPVRKTLQRGLPPRPKRSLESTGPRRGWIHAGDVAIQCVWPPLDR